MDNLALARAFEELADLTELTGDSPFKARAYRQFAIVARSLAHPVVDTARAGRLRSIEGVGSAIAKKIEELIASGTCGKLERLREAVPASVHDLLRVPGLGPKGVIALWQRGGITSPAALMEACEEGRVAQVDGFDRVKEASLLVEVTHLLQGPGTLPLAVARDVALRATVVLREAGAREAVVTGEARRGRDVVRELLLLARGLDAEETKAALEAAADDVGVASVSLERAPRGPEVVVQLDLGGSARVRPVPDDEWVRALLESTGSRAHLRWLQSAASRRGGLFAVCQGASREEDVYAALGLAFPHPELRDEPTPAVPADLPPLRGIFHVHTDWSDGEGTIVEMMQSCAARGLTYLGVSDHSKIVSYARGLDEARLGEQAHAVTIARREIPEFTLLHGAEVDILGDGSLDFDDETLAGLDFVIASVHTELGQGRDEMTRRLLRAVSHPLVTMLGHPSQRLLLGRRGFAFDLEAVADAAAANDTYLEINAHAQRLDLCDEHVRRAAARGARFVINPDAHTCRGIQDVSLGVTVARRARLSGAQVLNTLDAAAVTARLGARKDAALRRLRGAWVGVAAR